MYAPLDLLTYVPACSWLFIYLFRFVSIPLRLLPPPPKRRALFFYIYMMGNPDMQISALHCAAPLEQATDGPPLESDDDDSRSAEQLSVEDENRSPDRRGDKEVEGGEGTAAETPQENA